MRDSFTPYPTSQEIYERAVTIHDEEMWSDLYKKDLIEAGSMVGRRHLHQMEGSPYLEALLCWGFKRRENKETADLILEEAMMFTLMVGVEVLSDMGQMNKRVDALLLEMSEGLAKVQLNINKVDRWFTELDYQTEILEESRRGYQEFLAADTGRHQTLQREIGVLCMQCDGLVWMNRSFNQELGVYQNLVLLQTQTINAQNTYMWDLKQKVKVLEDLVLLEQTLGNPILIEDEEVREEDDLRSLRPPVVMTLIKIED